ncbi:MAG: 1-(5-phosphoribosyl)-5-[(5-phosphoribosylamino)methylideneamino]imidazole-4-carboxamide isomerase, partial [Beijerinckiaceae bacterium]
MILFPAIDLKEGQCVRLVHGDMDKATVFNDNPAAQAQAFERMGFEYLHVVDLDGAFAGRSMNAEAVEGILRSISMPLQLGGGIRTMENVEAWLTKGISRVIIGTAAAKNPGLVREAARKFPGQVAIGIDARDGHVAVEGWAETSQITAIELGKQLEDAGAAAVIYTDISRDGVLSGLNIEGTLELAGAITIPVIASGGLASIDEIRRLLEPDCRRLAGAISGRAIYDG